MSKPTLRLLADGSSSRRSVRDRARRLASRRRSRSARTQLAICPRRRADRLPAAERLGTPGRRSVEADAIAPSPRRSAMDGPFPAEQITTATWLLGAAAALLLVVAAGVILATVRPHRQRRLRRRTRRRGSRTPMPPRPEADRRGVPLTDADVTEMAERAENLTAAEDRQPRCRSDRQRSRSEGGSTDAS